MMDSPNVRSRRLAARLLPLLLVALAGCAEAPARADAPVRTASVAPSDTADVAVATLGGGCFWCIEAIFERLRGVDAAVSGYAGGHVDDPTYEQVSRGNTGHAEVVQITYRPDQISYAQLLEIFFTLHDPTTLNRQGPDVGPQYRSVVLYHDEAQRRTAREVIDRFEADGVWDDPIVTEVEPYDVFYPAEAYHQEYYANNPDAAYCRVVIRPKILKLQKEFLGRLKQ